jgi:hypothetical protein
MCEDNAESGEVLKVVTDWRDCSVEKVKKAIGIILLMGLDKKPEISNNLSKDPAFNCPLLWQSCSLSRDRFKQILTCLRFYDGNQVEDDSSLSKVLPFLNFVRRICQNNEMPQQNLSVDETLVPYKGRLEFIHSDGFIHSFRQFIPTKKARY